MLQFADHFSTGLNLVGMRLFQFERTFVTIGQIKYFVVGNQVLEVAPQKLSFFCFGQKYQHVFPTEVKQRCQRNCGR